MSSRLSRFWFVADIEDPFGVTGIGVTAHTEEDARRIVGLALPTLASLAAWRTWNVEKLARAEVLEDVDVRLLDQAHVVPNMGLVVDRGMWWPKL